MAGTLWEWCLNEFDDPYNTVFPKSKEDKRALRALRGGSWTSAAVPSPARPTATGTTRATGIVYVGFRVVCSSPSLGTER